MRYILAVMIVLISQHSNAQSFNNDLSAKLQIELQGEFFVPTYQDIKDQWARKMWLSKLVRKFWKENKLGSEQERWLSMNPEDVVREMIEDPRFENALLDFGLFYLGRQFDDGKYFETRQNLGNLAAFSQVIHLAKIVTSGEGDLFSIYDSQLPFYLLELPYAYFEKDGMPKVGPEARAVHHEQLMQLMTGLIGYINEPPETFDMQMLCKKVSESSIFDNLFGYGYFNILPFQSDLTYFLIPFFYNCNSQDYDRFDQHVLLLEFSKMKQGLDQLYHQTREFEDEVYHPNSVAEVKEAPSIIFENGRAHPFRMMYGSFLENSSTNFNRRRAAYVLDRFFCDDLTPVAVEDSGESDHKKHGTQASCMACHYRLDPMAGFFKNNGYLFHNFKGKKDFIFDDASRTDPEEYANNWRNEPGSKREWDIGFVSSTKSDRYNDYGETLEDLSEILKTAPEVRRCLTQRVFQFMTSTDQSLDGDYIDYLTDEFNAQAETDSVGAFKNLFQTAALSHTFQIKDPILSECYDYRPGRDPSQRPPCQVASILERNCVKCHRSPGGNGGLQLDTWKEVAPGQMSFVHIDSVTGEQVSPTETMYRISQRLSNPDPRKRMPFATYMDPLQRKNLYLWALEKSNQENW